MLWGEASSGGETFSKINVVYVWFLRDNSDMQLPVFPLSVQSTCHQSSCCVVKGSHTLLLSVKQQRMLVYTCMCFTSTMCIYTASSFPSSLLILSWFFSPVLSYAWSLPSPLTLLLTLHPLSSHYSPSTLLILGWWYLVEALKFLCQVSPRA